MSENGESPILWFRRLEDDVILEIVDDDDGEARLLRVSYSKTEIVRGSECILFSNGVSKWEWTTLDETEMKSLENLPCIEDFNETVEMDLGFGKDVEMNSIVIEDDVHVKLLQKIASNRAILCVDTSETGGEKQEAVTPGGVRKEEEEVQIREFAYDRGRTTALTVRGVGGDLAFYVEDVGDGEEKIVRVCVCSGDDGAEAETGCFLFRSDGEGMSIEVPDEVIDTLLEVGFRETSETAKLTCGEGWEYNYEQTYAVADQQSVIDILSGLVKDSILKLPLKNNSGPIESQGNGEATEEPLGDKGNLRANNVEECIDLGISTVESAHDERVAVMSLGPEESTSARHNLTEKETDWLRRTHNYDRNNNYTSDRIEREREHLSRLSNYDSNDTHNFDRNQNYVSDSIVKVREHLSRLWNLDSNDTGESYGPSYLNKMEEWFSLIWDYFLKGRDKVGWGQYILGRPPKKPGGTGIQSVPIGIWKMYFFYALMFASTVCAVENEQHPRPESALKGGWCWLMWDQYLSTLIFAIFVLLELISLRKEIGQCAAKRLTPIALKNKFGEAVESFITRFEVDRGNADTVHSVLFNCFWGDVPLASSEDPEVRVREFFEKIEADVAELSAQSSCKRDEIVRLYLKNVIHRNQSRNRQRIGLALSREDHVRIQYSAVRITTEVISKLEKDTQDTKSVTNTVTVPAETTVQKSEQPEELNCASYGTDVLMLQTQEEQQVDHEENVTQDEGEDRECVHGKKEEEDTITTAAESLGDHDLRESICGGKYSSFVINGTLFKGIRRPSHGVHFCKSDGGDEEWLGAEETLKQRNRRLLAEERERLKQRKAKIPKQKGEYNNCHVNSQAMEVKSLAIVEDRGDERPSTRVEHISKQREVPNVDRRWEFEVVSRMRDKMRTKAKMSGNATVKRVVWWRTRYFPKVLGYIIRIYSSSAYRFAAFRSNLSYIPGD